MSPSYLSAVLKTPNLLSVISAFTQIACATKRIFDWLGGGKRSGCARAFLLLASEKGVFLGGAMVIRSTEPRNDHSNCVCVCVNTYLYAVHLCVWAIQLGTFATGSAALSRIQLVLLA